MSPTDATTDSSGCRLRVVASGLQKRKLLDGSEDADPQSFLEDLIKDRASQSLAHLFTLLALVLPPEPMRIAFRGLHTDDPASIRPLWPFLDVKIKKRRDPS